MKLKKIDISKIKGRILSKKEIDKIKIKAYEKQKQY